MAIVNKPHKKLKKTTNGVLIAYGRQTPLEESSAALKVNDQERQIRKFGNKPMI